MNSLFHPESLGVAPTTTAKTGSKRRLDGFGTDSGPYLNVKPKVEWWHEEFATPQGNLNADSVTFEIQVPKGHILR